MVAPASKLTPRHVAITMDGNGRWAAARGLARSAGHRAGLTPVRMCIEECARRGVEALTLFAFSSENWGRPAQEVGSLMGLFVEALEREIEELHAKGVRLRFIGERRDLPVRLQARFAAAEARTAGNGGLKLQVAVVLLAIVLWLPSGSTVGVMTLLVLAGAWEWSAFLLLPGAALRAAYVLLVAALLPGAWRVCATPAGRELLLGVAVLWWLT